MDTTRHDTFRELLDREIGDELGELEHRELERHLAECGECRRERELLAALDRELAASRVPVRPDFAATVMAALPEAGWQSRHARAWRLPVALLLVLGAAAAFLLGSATDGAGLLGALGSIVALFGTALVAGAGLLGASWKGLGVVASGALAGSPLHLGIAALGILCLDLLVLGLLRRRRRSATAAATRRP